MSPSSPSSVRATIAQFFFKLRSRSPSPLLRKPIGTPTGCRLPPQGPRRWRTLPPRSTSATSPFPRFHSEAPPPSTCPMRPPQSTSARATAASTPSCLAHHRQLRCREHAAHGDRILFVHHNTRLARAVLGHLGRGRGQARQAVNLWAQRPQAGFGLLLFTYFSFFWID
jgi:hypothetical protein